MNRCVVWGLVAALACVSPIRAQTPRGVQLLEVRDPHGDQAVLYRESHALVIGVSEYRETWPDLPGVREDVEAVAAALESHGFQVTRVNNPTFAELDRAFRDFIRRHAMAPDHRILVYFAGHGHTVRHAAGDEMGYIVPADAAFPSPSTHDFMNSAMNMQQIEVYARTIQSKHALFLFDSCFSGTIFDRSRSGGIPKVISYHLDGHVRQFITAGSAEETVADESIFRRQFIAGIGGAADRNRDGYVLGSELGLFLQDQVIRYSDQHPQWGKIRHQSLSQGEFIFRVDPAAGDTRLREESMADAVRPRPSPPSPVASGPSRPGPLPSPSPPSGRTQEAASDRASDGQAVHAAIKQGDLERLRQLLAADTAADLVDARDALGRTPLHMAAYRGSLNMIGELLESLASPNARDDGGSSPLHVATLQGRLDATRLLIDHRASVDARNKNGETPLHLAVQRNSPPLVRLLVERLADVDAQDFKGIAPLHRAVSRGRMEIVRILVGRGANVMIEDEYQRQPLATAARNGDLELVELLLDHGADVNGRDAWLNTPLSVATSRSVSPEMVRFLLEKGADVEYRDVLGGGTLLHRAASSGQLAKARLLVEHGISPQARNAEGRTPRDLARIADHQEMVDLLESAISGDVPPPSSPGTRTAPPGVTAAAGPLLEAAKRGDRSRLRELLARADVVQLIDGQDPLGQTALHLAITRGHLESTGDLLAAEASPSLPDDSGNTPLHAAALQGHAEIARLLLDHHAVVDATNQNRETPLHLAIHKNALPIVRLLLDRQAKVDARDTEGATPLYLALDLRRTEIARLLVARGADVRLENHKKIKPLNVAAMRGDLEMVKLLLAEGADIEGKDQWGNTPLGQAVYWGTSDVVEHLLEQGANLTDRDMIRGESHLHTAVRLGKLETAASLIRHGIALQAKDRENRTALEVARMRGNLEMVEMLEKALIERR